MSEGKIDLIYDLVKDIDKKQDFQNERLVRLEEHVETNTKDLTIHKAGVETNRELIAQNKEAINERVDKMEEPRKAVKMIRNWIIGLGALSGAVFTMLKLIKAI